MGAFKFYEWEKLTFPKQHEIKVAPSVAPILTKRLADALGVHRFNGVFTDAITVNTNNRSWGRAFPLLSRIDLPASGCSLAMILHEIAHLMNWKKHSNKGHGKTFKTCVIKCYVEGLMAYPKLMEQIKSDESAAQTSMYRRMESAAKAAARAAERKAFQKTTAYRILKTSERIKRLERKMKGLASRLKSARRSLSCLERWAYRKEKVEAVLKVTKSEANPHA